MKVKNKFILAVTGCICAAALITAGAFSFLSSVSSQTDDGAVGVFDAYSQLYLSNPDAGNIGKNLEKMNPGDVHDIGLFVSNEGNKSLATKSYIYVLWDDDDFNKWSNHKDSIYVYLGNYSTSAIERDMLAKDRSNAVDCEYVENVDYDGEKYSGYFFETPTLTLNGSSGPDQELDFSGQTPQNFDWSNYANSGTWKYKFGFSNYANVHTEGKNFKVVSITKAIQYRNTNDSDWETIDVHEIDLGS